MAPINFESTMETLSFAWLPFVVSIVSSLLILISMVLLIVLCCCCGKSTQKGGEHHQSIFFSTDPNHPEYCQDCANAAMQSVQPTESQLWDEEQQYNQRQKRSRSNKNRNSPESYNRRRNRAASMHRYEHGAPQRAFDPRSPPSSPKFRSDRKRNGYRSGNDNRRGSGNENRRGSGSENRRGGSRNGRSSPSPSPSSSPRGSLPKTPPKLPSAPTITTSGRNPETHTLWNAKSNVFDQNSPAAPKGNIQPQARPEAQMKVAPGNPMYKTLWAAKSGVFDQGGGGGGYAAKTMAREVNVGGGGAAHGEAQMKAAQINPAYGTLALAKSNVFDQGGGGGRPPAHKSAYRE